MTLTSDIKRKLREFWRAINSLDWTPGVKHPLTPVTVFKNVFGYDRERSKNKARCQICDFAISDEEMERHELVFQCDKNKCLCPEPHMLGLTSHMVCDVCDSIYRSVYVNWMMKNRNYFKNLDEADAKLRGTDGRRRMGLD